MFSKMSLVDFPKCHPEKCGNGVCFAAQACPRNLLKQEQPGDIPMTDPFICQGCADCARACPLKAIRVVRT